MKFNRIIGLALLLLVACTQKSVLNGSAGDTSSGSTITPSSPTPTPSNSLNVQVTCSNAIVVGLEWSPLSGASTYKISRSGTTVVTTATTSVSDQGVSPSTSYAYTVSALNGSNSVLATTTLNVKTPAPSVTGDPAVCPSTLIKSMNWNWSTGYSQYYDGSDLWSMTWGADGKTYGFFGDGGGFNPNTGADGNHTERASYGTAQLTGTGPSFSGGELSNGTNIYGGFNTAHQSSLSGKAGSILAIGNNFYALGGIYRTGDTNYVAGSNTTSGAPNHYELVQSIGNAYSWTDGPWTFCSADDNGNVTVGYLCPGSFINFGPGYANAFDGYVYMYAFLASSWFAATSPPGPAKTYLMRVPTSEITTHSAYQYFTGVDVNGNATWSSTDTAAQPVFTDKGPKPIALGQAIYNIPLKRFIGIGQGAISQAAFYEAPTPWGPWRTIAYYNTNADGTGGWGNLGSTAYGVGHGESLGINFINAWTSGSGLSMWAVFSSDGNAPSSALLPRQAGNSMDAFSLVNVTLGQ